MVSLPPGPPGPKGPTNNPNSASHVAPEAARGGKPETVRYMLACWAFMIGGELLHQALAVVSLLMDPAELIASAKEASKQTGAMSGAMSEGLMNVAVWGSVALMALIQLSVLALFAFALASISRQRKMAGTARRLLMVFSVFFALRALMVFAMRPASTTVPLAFYAFDGVIQIMLGVAGALGLFYASQKESVVWVDAGTGKNGAKGA
ncbi:hypothetical protein [Corynebacterium sp. HMSC29G08]|uniref:hypothetical protein n=1 Tax=Corynebacterium sp. HMSC29G08 TaxID=1581069 RepID=UPI0008A45310|nr:hypothetical protein [Corynebacterium sp. HMSC29G08]